MSTIDLIVLGILLQNPQNAYELVRFIREREIHRVLKISEPAVFKSCKRLAEAGMLDGETVRTTGVPDKVVYAVNAQGKLRFKELMNYFVAEFRPYYFDFNTVLWNIEQMEKDEALQLLKNLQFQLQTAKGWIIEHEAEAREHLPFGPRHIVKQYRMTITALAQWIDEAVADYENS